jgi:hypothetical protein
VSLLDAELIRTANRVGGPRHCIFHGQRITEWQPIAFIDEGLERDQHSGFRRDHLAGKFSGGVKQFAVWNTAARKPPCGSLAAGKSTATQRQVLCPIGPYRPRETLRQTPARQETNPRMAIDKSRTFSDKDRIASQGNLESAGDRKSVNRCDHWSGKSFNDIGYIELLDIKCVNTRSSEFLGVCSTLIR